MLLWQAFPFPISGEVYKVSYEKMLAKNLDTTQAQDLTHVVDTEAYYKSLTQDGTTTGAPHTSCTPWQALFPFALTPQQLRLGSNLRFDSVLDFHATGPPKVPGAYAQMANLTLPGSIWVDYINTT